MRRRLPPLIALRVFECAARHLSFTRAADELCVTQAAVSHQIKALEEWLGVRLFERLSRSIKLTDAGALLANPLTEAFDILADATHKALAGENHRVLRISCLDSFTVAWVLPRLSDFKATYPDIDLRFLATRQEEDALSSGDADLEIRYGEGGWPGQTVIELMREDIFPVCSPELLDRSGPVRNVDDLQHFELLHDVLSIDWESFLNHFGASFKPTRGTGFTHSHLVLQACMGGNGVALGRSALVQEALRKGLLVRPLDISMPSDFGYFLVHRPGARAG